MMQISRVQLCGVSEGLQGGRHFGHFAKWVDGIPPYSPSNCLQNMFCFSLNSFNSIKIVSWMFKPSVAPPPISFLLAVSRFDATTTKHRLGF